jgi:hypothetical protein
MATIKLSTATVQAIGAWSSKKREESNTKTKAVDALFADGVTADMLRAPKGGEPSALYDSAKAAVVLGFTAAIQALLKKDTKGLNETQKADKRYWTQQIGSGLKDLRNALESREAKAKAEMEGSDGAGADKSSWESTKRKVLAEMISQAQKKESTTVRDMPAFIKDLQNALARIPANA